MKYRVFLTNENKLKCYLTKYRLTNGWNIVTVTNQNRNTRSPYTVTFSTGKYTYFRPNKCYWDDVDVSSGKVNDLTDNVELVPITLLKRKTL